MTVQEAIDIILESKIMIISDNKEECEEAIVTLAKEAQYPTPKNAEWIYVTDTPFFDNVYRCSNCYNEQIGSRLTHYCGTCGRKMKVK